MAKVILKVNSANGKALKIKFASLADTPGATGTFSGTVNWGDGAGDVAVTSNELTNTYTSGPKSRVIVVNAGWGDLKHLSFPKRPLVYVENVYVNPFTRSQITLESDSLNGDYVNIKSHLFNDFHGLNTVNTETVYIKSGTTWKLLNSTGSSITISDGSGSGDVTVATGATKNYTVPSSGTLTLTVDSGPSLNVVVASDFSNNPKNLRAPWSKFKKLMTSKLLCVGDNPYVGGYTAAFKQISIGSTGAAVDNNFKLHGIGDFAFFWNLRFLEHKEDADQLSQGLKTYRYTFAGCTSLMKGTNRSLISKLSDQPVDVTGMFAGTSKDVIGGSGKKQPIRIQNLNFAGLETMDRLFENSGFVAGLKSKINQMGDKAIKSAIAAFKGSVYSKGLWGFEDKLSGKAELTEFAANTANFDNASLKKINSINKIGSDTMHKGGAINKSTNVNSDIVRKEAALTVQTRVKPDWLMIEDYWFDGSIPSMNDARVMNAGDTNMYLVLKGLKFDGKHQDFPDWFTQANLVGQNLTFMIIKKAYKGSLLALNYNENAGNRNAAKYIATGVASGNGGQITDFSRGQHQTEHFDIATTLEKMRDIPAGQMASQWTGGQYNPSYSGASCNVPLAEYACDGKYGSRNKILAHEGTGIMYDTAATQDVNSLTEGSMLAFKADGPGHSQNGSTFGASDGWVFHVTEVRATEVDVTFRVTGVTKPVLTLKKSDFGTQYESIDIAIDPLYELPTNYDKQGRADFVVEYNSFNIGNKTASPERGIYEKDLFEEWLGTDEIELGMLFESMKYDKSSEAYLELRLPLRYRDNRAIETGLAQPL
jgi:hypothetical protein